MKRGKKKEGVKKRLRQILNFNFTVNSKSESEAAWDRWIEPQEKNATRNLYLTKG
jgi:hypothetical protein